MKIFLIAFFFLCVSCAHTNHRVDLSDPEIRTSQFGFSDGLDYFYKDKKCGFFDKNHNIIISPQYDECSRFDLLEDGFANVCKNCKKYCTTIDCYHSVLIGGENYWIDKNNNIKKNKRGQTIEEYCPSNWEIINDGVLVCDRSATNNIINIGDI